MSIFLQLVKTPECFLQAFQDRKPLKHLIYRHYTLLYTRFPAYLYSKKRFGPKPIFSDLIIKLSTTSQMQENSIVMVLGFEQSVAMTACRLELFCYAFLWKSRKCACVTTP